MHICIHVYMDVYIYKYIYIYIHIYIYRQRYILYMEKVKLIVKPPSVHMSLYNVCVSCSG